MFAHERLQSIVSLLAKCRKMTIHELQEELGVSPATLRRDLTELEGAGKVVRVRGAVVHAHYFRSEPSFAQKSRAAGAAKRAMALEAAGMVPPGSTVLVDAGSTCLEVGRVLLARPDLTIVTHSLPLAMMAHEASAKVLCIGGELRPISGAMVGALSLRWLEHLRAEWCFVGASGLSAEEGASTTELSEAAMKEAMLRRAPRRVLVADGRKWGHPVTVNFAGWNEFDFWITDEGVDDDALRAVERLGPQVRRCAAASGAKAMVRKGETMTNGAAAKKNSAIKERNG